MYDGTNSLIRHQPWLEYYLCDFSLRAAEEARGGAVLCAYLLLRQEEAVAFAMRPLRKKFGDVGAETEAQIKSLSPGTLEELGEALFDFTSVGDIAMWLRSHAGN